VLCKAFTSLATTYRYQKNHWLPKRNDLRHKQFALEHIWQLRHFCSHYTALTSAIILLLYYDSLKRHGSFNAFLPHGNLILPYTPGHENQEGYYNKKSRSFNGMVGNLELSYQPYISMLSCYGKKV